MYTGFQENCNLSRKMTITAENRDLLQKALRDTRIRENEQVSLGGKDVEVELYAEVEILDDLIRVVTTARTLALPVSILGIGFFPEAEKERIEGFIIKNNCRKFDILSMRGKVETDGSATEYAFATAETGASLNQIVRQTIDEGLGGLECFLGIGGTVGDNLIENIKSGEEDFLTSHIFTLRILTKENEVVEVSAEPFLYPLAGNMIQKKQIIPLSVVFKLIPQEKEELWRRGKQAAFTRNQSDLLDPLKGNFEF